ncbi:hypothetical protein GF362_03695 [Candidatus Dojkabacteria bacterium]|nr:hypothetical protein [Candidatus Dojkabacteria bacterium]
MKVEIFYQETADRPTFQDIINKWLEEHKDIKVKDIKIEMENSGEIEKFLAMIIYEEK